MQTETQPQLLVRVHLAVAAMQRSTVLAQLAVVAARKDPTLTREQLQDLQDLAKLIEQTFFTADDAIEVAKRLQSV